jgi:hypothetical protein
MKLYNGIVILRCLYIITVNQIGQQAVYSIKVSSASYNESQPHVLARLSERGARITGHLRQRKLYGSSDEAYAEQ